MALPLLLGIGAGILGGAQYLMKKQDDREVQSMLPQIEASVASSPFAGTQYGDEVLRAAQGAAQGGGFFDANQADRLSLLQEELRDRSAGWMQEQQTNQLAQLQQWMQSNEGFVTSIQDQRQQNQQTFGKIQDSARILDSLYKGGNLSGNNLQGMINAVARMQFPNEALNEGDIARIIAGSPQLAKWQNSLSGLAGRADPTLARSIYNFGQDLYSGYRQGFEAGERNVDDAIGRLRGQGYLPTERVQRRFGTYDPGFELQGAAPPSGGSVPMRDVQNNLMDSLNQSGRSVQDTVDYLIRLGFEEQE